MGKKMLIVQPHSDDALFNCTKFIFSDKFDVEILTVESDPKRILEDEKLYNFLGIKHFNIKGIEFIDDSYYGFFKMYKGVDDKNAIDFLNEHYGKDKMKEIKKAVLKFVSKFKEQNPDCIVLIPLGIAHPFHYFIHKILLEEADLFYREFPHSYKKRSQEQLQTVLKDYNLWGKFDNLEAHAMKFELAKKFYKTQSGLLFYEQGYIKKQLPEEFYVRL